VVVLDSKGLNPALESSWSQCATLLGKYLPFRPFNSSYNHYNYKLTKNPAKLALGISKAMAKAIHDHFRAP
jgi:hypothetical protein